MLFLELALEEKHMEEQRKDKIKKREATGDDTKRMIDGEYYTE